MAEKNESLMEKVISLCKRRGFIYPSSEIYGGIAGFWDYGPLGVELRHNIKQHFWNKFISEREDMYPVSTSIIMSPKVWEASGHAQEFSDPAVECLTCFSRYRVDQIIDIVKYFEFLSPLLKDLEKNVGNTKSKHENARNIHEYIKSGIDDPKYASILKELKYEIGREADMHQLIIDALSKAYKLTGIFAQSYLNYEIKCPSCSSINWNVPKKFGMMFETTTGVGESSSTFLRPETAQGMFANFKNIVDSFHPKLPFGMAQIGKSFRNEISPRDFLFRQREFEQMEIEYFVDPRDPDKIDEIFDMFYGEQQKFLQNIGLSADKIHKIDVPEADRAHYSKRSVDTEFDFPFGQKELLGLAYRTDFDLKAHSEKSGVDLSYYDEETKERFVPHCIEPTMGVDRLVLAVLTDAYTEDELGGETRSYLKLAPLVAPVRAAVFPLLKNKPELVAKAREVYSMLKKEIPNIEFDDNGNIGKRYRRQDEIGTPHCITIDFGTLGEENPEQKDTVTLRDRDSGEQERVKISELLNLIK
jgi:glycyl-tRNA synthetase